MSTTKTAAEIAAAINASNETYYGEIAKAWTGGKASRIYFGLDYVTIEAAGEIHNRRGNRARSQTIGHSAVELVEKHA
jgi:hypothetical protein